MPEKAFELLPKIINGSLGAMIGLLCIFPLDLVKTRMQNQQLGEYSSILDCFRKTYRSEGFWGMYRGVAVTMLLVSPEKSVKLATNDYVRHILRLPDGTLPLPRQMVAGAVAGLSQVIFATPMEFMKIQLQDAGRIQAATGINKELTAVSIFKKMYRRYGLFGVFRGALPTAMRDISFSTLYFPLFASITTFGPRKSDSSDASSPVTFAAGLISGCVAAFLVTPFDVVKTRLQSLKKRQGERHFNGIIDCVQKTFQHEGVKAFFKGGLCRIMVISPLYGVVQTIYFLGVGEALVDFFFST